MAKASSSALISGVKSRFWASGYFRTTSGNVTDEIILRYLESHPSKPTDIRR